MIDPQLMGGIAIKPGCEACAPNFLLHFLPAIILFPSCAIHLAAKQNRKTRELSRKYPQNRFPAADTYYFDRAWLGPFLVFY